MMQPLAISMDAHGRAEWFYNPRQQILRFGNRDLGEGFQSIKHFGLVERSFGDLCVDRGAPVNLDVGKRLHRLPEAIIVETVEPLFEFILIVKKHHAASVPKRARATQICAGIPRSPWPAEGASA